MKFDYKPKGVCARKFTIELDGDIIKDFQVEAGCPGNSLGLAALVKNRPIAEVIEQLEGIKCGKKKTSCPDQLSQALANYLKTRLSA